MTPLEAIVPKDWGAGIDARSMSACIRILQQGLRPRFVYFAEARSYEEESFPTLVKIGTTVDPARRLKEIELACARGPEWLSDKDNLVSLGFMGLLLGDEELEQQLHKAFATHRVSGEWFWLDPLDEVVDILLSNFCVCSACLVTDDLFLVDE